MSGNTQDTSHSIPAKIGPYTIHSHLDDYGEISSHLASDESGQQVIFKLVSGRFCESDKRAVRFMREQKVLAEMNHPNISSVLATGSYDGRPWFVSEIDSGQTLEQRVATGPLDPLVGIDYMCQVARGLEAAAKKNIIHGSLQPSNIILTNTGILEIVDFGLVETEPSRGSQATNIFSLSDFTAPEFVRGDSIDLRADMYAMGITFFYLLSGNLPFPGKENHVLVTGGRETRIPLLHQKKSNIPVSLSSTISMLMASAPEARFQTYSDLTKHLIAVRQSILSGSEAMAPASDLISPNTGEAASNRSYLKAKGFKKLGAQEEKSHSSSFGPILAFVLLLFIVAGTGVILYSSGVYDDFMNILVAEEKPVLSRNCSLVLKGTPAGEHLRLFQLEPWQDDGTLFEERDGSNPLVTDEQGDLVRIGSTINKLSPGKYMLKNMDSSTLAPFKQEFVIKKPGETKSVDVTVGFARTSVKLESEPSGARIFIDGKDAGMNTPGVAPDLEMKAHLFRFELSGANPMYWEGQIDVGPGEEGMPFIIKRPLVSLKTPVTFSSDPSGVQVLQLQPSIEKPVIGATFNPVERHFTPGTYRFRFSLDGFDSVEKDVVVAREPVEVNVQLPYCSIALELNIDPPDAAIEFTGKDIDPSARKLFFLPGEYELLVKKDGYQTEKRILKISGPDPFEVTKDSQGNDVRSLKRSTFTCDVTLKAKYEGPEREKPFLNTLGMRFVWIDKGEFSMGSSSRENGHQAYESPVRKVRIGRPFWIGAYEVSQDAWEKLMGNNPSYTRDPLRPVDSVSHSMAMEFCDRLTASERKNGLIGRNQYYLLPSEAQWEYVCRAHTTTPFFYGNSLSSKDANFDGNYPYGGASKGAYRNKTTLTGFFKPNGFGVYDMHGNLMEWCSDIWHDSYRGAPEDHTSWVKGKQGVHVLRGGAFSSAGTDCRSASRMKSEGTVSHKSFGFRVILTSTGG